jgi:hypothetical protein
MGLATAGLEAVWRSWSWVVLALAESHLLRSAPPPRPPAPLPLLSCSGPNRARVDSFPLPPLLTRELAVWPRGIRPAGAGRERGWIRRPGRGWALSPLPLARAASSPVPSSSALRQDLQPADSSWRGCELASVVRRPS